MGTRYYKLFDMLNRRGMKKSDLRKILSPNTVAKLSKGEYISGEAIEKICMFLECQPGDIMEIVFDEKTFIDELNNRETESYKTYKHIDNLGLPNGEFELTIERDVESGHATTKVN